uniref:Retrotransposon gag domain-containing protein n=1 Tax=Fagus sylvatica TaxID=28930 RepID=A0A2N9FQ15_FAGSY
MTGETSGPSAQDIRMASFEEKFNDLLNFVRLLVKRDTENERQAEDINKDTSEDNLGRHSHTNSGPPLVQPSKPKEGDFQLDVKVEKTMGSTKMVDASALLALAKPDVENEARTVNPNATPENDPSPKGNWNTLEGPQSLQMYGNGEENVMNKKEDDHSDIRIKNSEKEAQSPISKKEEPKEVDHPMIPHKRYTPKNVVERVEQLEKRLDEVVQSMHQLITLTGTLLKDDRKAIRDLASHSPRGQASTKSLSKRETGRHRRQETLMLHTGRYQSGRNLSSVAKLKSESRKFCTLPMPMDELYPRLLEKRLISPVFLKQSPHLLHDSSKKCEFHFGRPGHSLEDCHALKNKVQDLVDHGILRINEGSTPSVIIAWPPERRKDETVIPSPQSQGPTTCGIQPVHLTTLPTLSEVGEHTVPKTQPKLMSNFRNLDDQCSSDKEKAEYRASRCVTLKRKIQELGHSELEVPAMVQARKPSMHTVPMKKARSTLGFRANEPSRDQTERTISRSTGAWIPHRQG